MQVSVFVLIKRNKKHLLVKRSQPKYHRKWYLPGGVMNQGDNIVKAITSKAKTATGYDIALNGIFYIHFVSRPASERGLCIYFNGRIIDGKMKADADEHSLECGWFDPKGCEALELWGDLPDLLAMDEMPLIPTSQVVINLK